MTLDDSLFVSDTLHERPVKLPDGTIHSLHFRELPAQDFIQYRQELSSDNEETRRLAPARLIARALANPDGTLAITAEKAATLKLAAAEAMMRALMEANSFIAKKDSPSAVESGSSTS